MTQYSQSAPFSSDQTLSAAFSGCICEAVHLDQRAALPATSPTATMNIQRAVDAFLHLMNATGGKTAIIPSEKS